MITTYTGENKNPLPSFTGDPLDIKINDINAKKFAQNFYDAMAPKQGSPDLRVGVIVMYKQFSNGEETTHIINRCDL